MDHDETSLAPGFLIAPPGMGDPNFAETLVLLAVHDETGSMGFVINRGSSLMLGELLRDLEIESATKDRGVLYGGPVSTFTGFVVYEHPKDEPLAPGLTVSETVSVSPSFELLEKAAQDGLPGRFELLLGYAGWAPDQLHEELGRGGWLHSNFDAELVFDVGIDERWEEAYSRLGVLPGGFIDVPGGAQA